MILYTQMLSFLDSLLIDFAVFKSGVIYVVQQLARGFLIVLVIFIVVTQQLFVTSFQDHDDCDTTDDERKEALAPFCKPVWHKSFLKVFTMMRESMSIMNSFHKCHHLGCH